MKIETVPDDDDTCHVTMTATKLLKPATELKWVYAAGDKTLARPTDYQYGAERTSVFTDVPLQDVSALVRKASGAGAMEVPLTLVPMAGDGNCFYKTLLAHLTRMGQRDLPTTVKQLRKRLSDHFLKAPQEVVDGFATWLSTIDADGGGIPKGLQTYRNPERACTLDEYAKRVTIGGNYANHFDIVHLLLLF